MLKDRIDRVVVAGKSDGVHLEPRPAVVADSLKSAGPSQPRTSSTSTIGLSVNGLERFADLFATKDSSLALAAGALARIADDQRRASSATSPSPTGGIPQAAGSCQGRGDAGRGQPVGGRRARLPRELRTAAAGNAEGARAAMGALWGDVPIAFHPEVWRVWRRTVQPRRSISSRWPKKRWPAASPSAVSNQWCGAAAASRPSTCKGIQGAARREQRVARAGAGRNRRLVGAEWGGENDVVLHDHRAHTSRRGQDPAGPP